MENQEQLTDLLAQHASWQNHILHFKGDLKAMKDELGMIVAKFSPREVPASTEHFQNQIILQKEVLDILRHDFKQYENQLESAMKNSGNPSEHLLSIRDAYNSRLNDFDKFYKELKNEFETFKNHESIPA